MKKQIMFILFVIIAPSMQYGMEPQQTKDPAAEDKKPKEHKTIKEEFKKVDEKVEEFFQKVNHEAREITEKVEEAVHHHHHHHHHHKSEDTATQTAPTQFPLALIEAVENTSSTPDSGSKKHHDPAADAERARTVQIALHEAETLAAASGQQKPEPVTFMQEITKAEHEILEKIVTAEHKIEQDFKETVDQVAAVIHPPHEEMAAANKEIIPTHEEVTTTSKIKEQLTHHSHTQTPQATATTHIHPFKQAFLSLKNFAHRAMLVVWHTILGKPHSYEPDATDSEEKKIYDLKVELIKQGYAVNAERCYRIKRILKLGSLATIIGSAFAYRSYGISKETGYIGLGVGTLAGLLANSYRGKSAHLKKIATEHNETVRRALEAQVTAEDAQQAYTQAITRPEDDNRWFYSLRTFGPWGKSEMNKIKNEIADGAELNKLTRI